MKILIAVSIAFLLVGCNAEEQTKKMPEKESVKTQEKEPTGIKSTIAPVRIVSGKSLFSKCTSCHGEDASQKALGKSQVIKGWSVEKLTNAIEGYQNGTYGGDMKGMMRVQVKDLNSVDINIISNYISKL
ncbi:cytochrome c [Sulfurimonas sp.]|uniref:c-type cytochrome n=1 Tax=Sulfurimonas sp. TaxID=2022749 RepID=UPI0035651166